MFSLNVLPGQVNAIWSHYFFSDAGVTEEIVRPDSIYLTWQDVKGEHHADEPSGLLTVCIQHEIDHLEGKLMVDYLSPLKRDRIRKKASK